MNKLIAFIGGGNMGAGLLAGLLAAGHDRTQLRAAEPDAERAEWLRRSFGVTVCEHASDAVAGARAVVLAVKPQTVPDVVSRLELPPGCVFISIAAGIGLDVLRQKIGTHVHYVRTMPNMAAQVRRGVTGLYAPKGTPAAACELAESILASIGRTCWVPREELLDAVTAVSGSGPAYFFLLVELLRDAGTALGLDGEVATLLARQTLIGAAALAEQADVDVATLRQRITSKGGTTEAALRHLQAADLPRIVADAVRAARDRARELGKQSGH